MVRTTWIAIALTCCVVWFSASTSVAGILNGHPDAMAGWSGSVPFDNGLGLKGDLDFAVFTAANFNANFAGLGYVPGDAVVYTYQLLNDGSDNISAEIVGIVNPANTIGSFDIGDVNASSASFIATHAQWVFSPPVAAGQTSWGLAFSSPNVPMDGVALTLDGGAAVLMTGIPTPSHIPIPEPSCLALLACCGVTCCMRRKRS